MRGATTVMKDGDDGDQDEKNMAGSFSGPRAGRRRRLIPGICLQPI
jgi:hypothetical protein